MRRKILAQTQGIRFGIDLRLVLKEMLIGIGTGKIADDDLGVVDTSRLSAGEGIT